MGGGKKAPAPPQLQAPREVPLSETFAKFLSQREQFPGLADMASAVNLLRTTELETGLPGTLSAASQVSTLVNQLLEGVVPAGTAAETQRALAQRRQAVGLPATSEAQIFSEARTIGQTAGALQQLGLQYTPGLMQLSEFMSPQQVQNYLFSTGQLRGEALKQAQDEANVANQNAINKYNYDVANSRSSGGFFGQIGGLLGGVAGFALGGPAGAGIGSALGGSIGNFAGGGGFAPPAGAGGFGGLIGNLGSGLLGGGGGLAGASQGLSATAFSPMGQAFTMPTASYFTPTTGSVLNPLNNFLVPQSRGSYGGQYPISVGGLNF
jgi:hypothetical protein